MNAKPLVLHQAKLAKSSHGATRDRNVFEDDLPAVLDRNTGGYVISRSTTVTEVKQETVDDN